MTRRWLLAPALLASAGVVVLVAGFHVKPSRVAVSTPAPVSSQLSPSPVAALSAPSPRVSPSRASRTRHTATGAPRLAGAPRWAASADAVRVANCESADLHRWPHSSGARYLGGPRGVHNRAANGHYGKWQFAPSTWRSVGGRGNAADASEREQDYRAWLLWRREGWRPWECASILGIS